jgi:hypothetical protein
VFLYSLGIDASKSADLLESIGNALLALDLDKIEGVFKNAGAEFWSRVAD